MSGPIEMVALPKILLTTVLLGLSASFFAQSGVKLHIVQPTGEDKCNGRMKVVAIDDCGIPGFELCSSLHGELKEGQIVKNLCPSEFELSWSDSSGQTVEKNVLPGWGTGNGVQETFSPFSCFDSIYYDPTAWVHGVARRTTDRKELLGVTVSIASKNGRSFNLLTDADGYYEMYLPLEDIYILTYSLDKHYTKSLRVDTHISNKWIIGAGFSTAIDMGMIPKQEGLELEMLDEPMSTLSFNREEGSLEFDMERTRRIKEEVRVALKKAKGE